MFGIFFYAEAPSQPTDTKVFFDEAGTAVLEWKPPTNDGGEDVLGYHIELRHSGSTTWKRVSTEITRKCRYVVKDLKPGDEADAHVLAVNEKGEGEPSQPPVHIVVPEKKEVETKRKSSAKGTEPMVTVKAKTVEIFQGKSVSLEATFTGEPCPTVEWTFNSTKVKEDRRVKVEERRTIKTSKLTIVTAESVDQGTYTVTVRNVAGEATADIILTVLAKPGPPGELTTAEITDEAIVVTWSTPDSDGGTPIKHFIVEKRPASKSTWIKVTTTTERVCTVKDLVKATAYHIRVRAVTEQGEGPNTGDRTHSHRRCQSGELNAGKEGSTIRKTRIDQPEARSEPGGKYYGKKSSG